MPHFCAVVNCGSRSERDKVSFFRFPSIYDNNKRIDERKQRRRLAWIRATRRTDLNETKLKNQMICAKHFLGGKPAKLDDEIHPDWVPTQNMGYKSNNSVNLERYTRRRYRKGAKVIQSNSEPNDMAGIQQDNMYIKSEVDDEEPVYPIEEVFVECSEPIKLETIEYPNNSLAEVSDYSNHDSEELYSNAEGKGESETKPFQLEVKSEQPTEIFFEANIPKDNKPTVYNSIPKKRRNPSERTNLMTQISENSWQCVVCKLLFEKRENLVQHVKIHIGEKPYACSDCSYRGIRKSHLLRHIKTHKGEKPVECELCGYKCSLRGTLSVHMKIHSNNRPFKCNRCDYAAVRRPHLNRHMKIHGENIISDCVGLQQKTYINKNCDMQDSYRCMVCPYITTRKTHLEQHIKTHTGEKPHKCKICDRAFSMIGNYRVHMKTHTGEKPFKCSKCDYKAVRRNSVRQHIKATHVL